MAQTPGPALTGDTERRLNAAGRYPFNFLASPGNGSVGRSATLRRVTGRHSHGESPVPIGRRATLVLALALAPFALATLIGLAVNWPSGRHASAGSQVMAAGGGRVDYFRAQIIDVQTQQCDDAVGRTVNGRAGGPVCVAIVVRLAGGPDQGRAVTVAVGNADPASFAAGQQVRLGRVRDPTTGAASYVFDDLVRDVPLGALAAVFAVVVVLVARWRGLAALAGLGVTYLVLVTFLLPALLDGRSPVLVGLTAAATILFVVLYLSHGVSARTSAALLGTLLSLALTGVLAAVFTSASRLTGLSSEATSLLQSYAGQVSVSGLLLCGLIIGTLGVLNDATVTQASAVWELSAADPRIRPARLYRSAMRIGRDHIASTIYTLVLAYAGSALPALLLFSLSGRSVHDVLTGDEIATEVLRGLVGGIGIAASVPITTVVAVLVVSTTGHRVRIAERTATAVPASW